MAEYACPQCGASNAPEATVCEYCGEALTPAQPVTAQAQQAASYQQPVYQQPMAMDGINPAWPIKSKIAAGILAILLGSIGVHKFYLGKVGLGILYLVFCWTGIPAIAGLIEGIIYLTSNDHNFQVKNQVRIQ